jgi:hypothetical protein
MKSGNLFHILACFKRCNSLHTSNATENISTSNCRDSDKTLPRLPPRRDCLRSSRLRSKLNFAYSPVSPASIVIL